MVTKEMTDSFRQGAMDVWGDSPPPWAPDWAHKRARKARKGRKTKKHRKAAQAKTEAPKEAKTVHIGEITYDRQR